MSGAHMRRDRGDIGREIAVALIGTHQRANLLRCRFQRFGTRERVTEVETLRGRQQLDSHNRRRVLRHVEQTARAMRRHRDMVFLVCACGHRIDGCGMREHAVLSHQRRGGYLRDHEP